MRGTILDRDFRVAEDASDDERRRAVSVMGLVGQAADIARAAYEATATGEQVSLLVAFNEGLSSLEIQTAVERLLALPGVGGVGLVTHIARVNE